MKYADFSRLATTRGRGLRQHQRLKTIWDHAHSSIGCSTGMAAAFEAQVLVKVLRQVRETIGSIQEKVKEISVLFPEYQYLLSMPGFGPDVSAKVLATIGDPLRFESGNQVLKTAGWDLNANRSGKRSDSIIPVISKRGKAGLRYALYQAALVASTKDKYFTFWFIEKLKGREREKGIKAKMRVKLAAKLLIIVYPVKCEAYFTGAWTLMKKKELFRTEYLKGNKSLHREHCPE